ncbi:hypothetical protein L596_004815 [Steinernema carpocapsae]|uniref:UDP-N-acetylglucosamine diphosphorylase n=1 Tax=Steinernema carpocapsae TaxID=34508 RepID=A0A4U8V158_STECR|nr:hypothetical protein L596_004815 [Steinernema carpocapsae]
MSCTLENEVSDIVTKYDQGHLLTFYEGLSKDRKYELKQNIRFANIAEACEGFQRCLSAVPCKPENLRPIPSNSYMCRKDLTEDSLKTYRTAGIRAIASGKIAAIVLAGGQATRLGASVPKGALPLGMKLTEGDNLLSLQAAQIVKLQALAKEAYPGEAERTGGKILWLIMTSKPTRQATEECVAAIKVEHGLVDDQVVLFDQPTVPCFEKNGKILLSEKWALSSAPNGNGGLYSGIEGFLPLMKKKGIEYIHVYCVDNVLCRIADPYFLGAGIVRNADCAAKVVEKQEPREAVGVICQLADSGNYSVIEYSELSESLAAQLDDAGKKLAFRAGNIANHLFSMTFLERVVCGGIVLPYHQAEKKIPYVDLSSGEKKSPSTPNGIKMEKFIFDVFPFANHAQIARDFCN